MPKYLRFLRCNFRVLRMLYITLNLKSLVINAKTLILHYNLYVDIISVPLKWDELNN